MKQKLAGRRIAALMADGFEEVEFTEPKQALEREGAEVIIVSPNEEEVKAWNRTRWGNVYPVDKSVDDSNSADFDALLLPGGVMNPDKLRTNRNAIRFIADFIAAGKPIAAICHAPQILTEIDFLQGRKVTSHPSIRTDLKNAGAEWIDEAVVVDNGIVTSRYPDDILEFNRKMIEEFCEGRHDVRRIA